MMTRFFATIGTLARDATASMAIETALVTPILALLAIGGFEASGMVARQSELQSAAAEAAAISLAVPPETEEEVNAIRDVIKFSTGLTNDEVFVSRIKRCGVDDDYIAFTDTCAPGVDVSTFLNIYITDTYTPPWVDFGIGETLTYRVLRTVQIS